MFIDDISRMKETLQNLNEVIGVFTIHDYQGINKEFLPYCGDNIIFQCSKEPFFKYCEENHITPKVSKHRNGNVSEYYIEIDGNTYFTLE